jgi:HEAT repeat protein
MKDSRFFVLVIIATLVFPLPSCLFVQEPKPGISPKLKREIDGVILRLSDKDYKTRQTAEEDLRNLVKDPKSLDSILAYLQKQSGTVSDTQVKISIERVVKPYIEWGITGYLQEKFADAMNLLISGDEKNWEIVARELGNSRDPETVDVLIRIYISAARYEEFHPLPACSSDISATCWPAEALVKIGKPAVEPVIKLLGDKDSIVRRCAPWVLAKIGDPKAVEPLIQALGDTDEHVRALSAEALGMLKHPKAVKPLIAALYDKDSCVRRDAARALGKIKDISTVEPLVRMLEDTTVDVRYAAIEALSKIGDPKFAESLIPFLKDKEVWVRATAAWALGKFRFVKAIEPLIGVLGDKQSDPRAEAVRALGRIGDVKAVEQLIPLLRDSELANLLEEGEDNFWWKGTTVREITLDTILSFGKEALPFVRESSEKKENEDIKDRLIEIIKRIENE